MSRLSLKALQAAAGAAAGEAVYVDDVFSTYLYEGTATSDTYIENGINLWDEGGLVWIKNRGSAVNHCLFDSARGAGGTDDKRLFTNSTSAETTGACDWAGFRNSANGTGFVLNGNGTSDRVNQSGENYASWTFRKQPGFFDVVTYTGDGVAGRQIAHNLGSTPGMMIVKSTSDASGWAVYHRSLGATQAIRLDSTSTSFTASNYWNDTEPTDSVFTLGTAQNANGIGFVAYLFAHDDQRFGENEDESIISCGSYTASTNAFTDLGWEPQWIIYKDITNTGGWVLWDTMRGLPGIGTTPGQYFQADLSDAEGSSTNNFKVGATGFYSNNGGGRTYIYVAIRRPHKPAEEFAATDLFAPTYAYQYDIEGNTSSLNGIHGYLGNPTDLFIQGYLSGNSFNALVRNRMTGSNYLISSSTSAETTSTVNFWDNNVGSGFETNNSVNNTLITYNFRRAPGFFDVVTYTGTNGVGTVSHNLGVAPELIVVKNRGSNVSWPVYYQAGGINEYLYLNQSAASATYAYSWGYQAPSETQFYVNSDIGANTSSNNYIAYLFATVPGISKVGTYTGTNSNVDVNCGFTSGARFVLVKRTDSTGDWYLWDSERGIVAGNDPYLLLNDTAAQVTSTDYIDPLSSGFTITSTAPAALNASGGEYLFLAIA